MSDKNGSVEGVSLDYKAIWVAISRSTKFKGFLDDMANEVADEAKSIASIEANDKGIYKDSFKAASTSANKVRSLLFDNNARRNRQRAGTFGKTKFFDSAHIDGDVYGSDYSGQIGVVKNTNYKAHWVEYGSMANEPRFVLTKASSHIAKRYGYEWVHLFNRIHHVNIPELKTRISKGMKENFAIRKEHGLPIRKGK